MNAFLLLSALLALTAAAPSGVSVAENRSEELAAMRRLPALNHEEVHDEFGQYALRYVTAEGIVVSERGRLVPNAEGNGYVLVIEGEVSYVGDDGQVYVTKFTAGLDGNHVEGNQPTVPIEVLEETLPAEADIIE